MKLNREILKKMIGQTIQENKERSAMLYEVHEAKYDRIMAVLEGDDGNIKTVVIMSGQNPMAQGSEETGVSPEVYSATNLRLAEELEKEVKRLGFRYDKIAGIFAGLKEKSLLIYNIGQFTADKLCRRFDQWGFVWGEKYPMNKDENFMAFKMLQIDYDQEMGWAVAPYSKETGFVISHTQLSGVEDNVSLDPTSGKKFGVELYEGK